MHTIIKILISVFVLMICFDTSSAQLITLQECQNWAIQNTPLEKQFHLIEEAKKLNINNANRTFWPQVSLNGQASWQSEVTGLPINLPNVPKLDKDQYKLAFEVNQTIYDGGIAKSQKQMAEANANLEDKFNASAIYQLMEQINTYYFLALLAEKQYNNVVLMQNEIERQIKSQTAGVEYGTASKSVILILQAKLLEIELALKEMRSRKLTALKSLSILTGKEINEASTFSDKIEMYVESNEITRPELAQYDAQRQMAEAGKSLISSKYAPKLNLFANAGYGRPGLNFLSSEFSPYFIGGLALKIPVSHIYTKTNKNELALQDINASKIENQKDAFMQMVMLKLASQKEELARLQDVIKGDEKLIELRTKIKETSENRLKNGVITINEYITDVDNETMARQNLSLHQIQLMQIIENIKITTGNK